MLAITIFQVKTLRSTKYQLINGIVQFTQKDLKPKWKGKNFKRFWQAPKDQSFSEKFNGISVEWEHHH